MSYGLKVWDASGAIVLDISDTVGLIVGYGSLSISSTQGTVQSASIPGAVASDKIFITRLPRGLYCLTEWSAPTLKVTSQVGSGTLSYVVVR